MCINIKKKQKLILFTFQIISQKLNFKTALSELWWQNSINEEFKLFSVTNLMVIDKSYVLVYSSL